MLRCMLPHRIASVPVSSPLPQAMPRPDAQNWQAFHYGGRLHRSSSSSSGCRRLLCDRRSLDDVVAPQGQHCLAAWASARSTVAEAWLVLTMTLAQQAPSAAVSLERTAVSPSNYFACFLTHVGPRPRACVSTSMHRLLCRKAFQLRLTSRLGACVHLHSCSG
jgi:hypothetical protein